MCLFVYAISYQFLFISVHLYPFLSTYIFFCPIMCLNSGAHGMASCALWIWVLNQVNSERAVAVGWNSCGSQAQFFLDLWNGLFQAWRDISQNQLLLHKMFLFYFLLLLPIFWKWTRKYLNVFLLVLKIMLNNNIINIFQRNCFFLKYFVSLGHKFL